MRILKIFLSILLFANLSFAISQNEIEPIMNQKVKQAVEILKDKSILKDDKPKQIFNLFDEYFDYKLMSKLSLSKRYSTLTPKQASEFDKAYEIRLKQSFIEKLALYTDQDMKVVGTEKPNSKRFNLKTEIIGEDKNYPIVFKFYPVNDNEWKVYDVDILGVSIIQTYRSQFKDLVANASFDELLSRLNSANLPDEESKNS